MGHALFVLHMFSSIFGSSLHNGIIKFKIQGHSRSNKVRKGQLTIVICQSSAKLMGHALFVLHMFSSIFGAILHTGIIKFKIQGHSRSKQGHFYNFYIIFQLFVSPCIICGTWETSYIKLYWWILTINLFVQPFWRHLMDIFQ